MGQARVDSDFIMQLALPSHPFAVIVLAFTLMASPIASYFLHKEQ